MYDTENNLTNNNPMQIDRFMKDSYMIAGIQDGNFASKFQLDENYETTDNTFSIPYNNMGIHDSLSYSGSSEMYRILKTTMIMSMN